MKTVEQRAVTIAAICLRAAGVCRYDDVGKCRRLYADDRTCEKCIEKWLYAKARSELRKELKK